MSLGKIASFITNINLIKKKNNTNSHLKYNYYNKHWMKGKALNETGEGFTEPKAIIEKRRANDRKEAQQGG